MSDEAEDKTEESSTTAKIKAAKASDEARIAAREAEPLREFCARLKDVTVPTQQIRAHRVLNLGADGWPLFTVAPADSRWIRFIVYRNGREDVVAMFREAEVLYVIETNAEPV